MTHRPELLAPAGDRASLMAALAAGADAVYFGLDGGFNARARATNFRPEHLSELVQLTHLAGAKAYLALNTLVFDPELPALAESVHLAAQCGVDALIVQDPAVALIARAVCPTLPIHASTQMTISTGLSARFAERLGVSRVVLPRELSVAEVGRFVTETPLETEVFIHGALCVAWSGQCLTSEAWGERSANRGQCSQACRMPYDLEVDGVRRDLGEVRYLLSPKDLAGARAVPALAELGVHGLKIEGRQKGPAYVSTAVTGYRRLLNAVAAGEPPEQREAAFARDLGAMTLAYTRGFSDGFLAGSDHQTLVEGRFPKHRGACLGRVTEVAGSRVWVESTPSDRPWTGALAAPGPRRGAEGSPASPLSGFGAPSGAGGPLAAGLEPRAGQGAGFDTGHPEENEPGGPIFGVERSPKGWILRFGHPGPDLSQVRPGDRVWLSGDPSLDADATRPFDPQTAGRLPLHITVTGAVGGALQVRGTCNGAVVQVEDGPILPSRGTGQPFSNVLREKLGALGGTPFHLGQFDTAGVPEDGFLPPGNLKRLRRQMVDALQAAPSPASARTVSPWRKALDAVHQRWSRCNDSPSAPAEAPAALVPLCRTFEQLDGALDFGAQEIELDWMEWTGLGVAVERVRAAGAQPIIATLRVEKPGEAAFLDHIRRLQPHGVLIRHWGALMAFQDSASTGGPALHGDFSLNVSNGITAGFLLQHGLRTLTPSFDLNGSQVFDLLGASDPQRFTVALHHRIATFHTEHCVYSHLLSQGRDHRTCGRPCEHHRVSLRDTQNRSHPVIVDAGCRNTVFNSEAQTATPLVPALLAQGVRRFRVECVREDRDTTARLLDTYARLLRGELPPDAAASATDAVPRFGVAAKSIPWPV